MATLPNSAHTWSAGVGDTSVWLEKYSSVDRLSMRQEKKEEGREDRQAGENISLCARSTVPFNVQKSVSLPPFEG